MFRVPFGVMLAAAMGLATPAQGSVSPADSVPPWVAEVERSMVVADVDWSMLASQGPAWMSYWDQHVRNTGKR